MNALDCSLAKHHALCAEILALTQRDHQWLRAGESAFPFESYQGRKEIVPLLDASLAELRAQRAAWQRLSPDERAGQPRAQGLMRACQDLTMKILALDRENQQALLRRGLLPPAQIPASASQRPHFVADLYQRHR